MVVMANRSDLTGWLTEHPKMIGVLWALMLLIAEAGSALAGAPKTGP